MQDSDSLMTIAMFGKLFLGLIIVLGIMCVLVYLLKYLQKKKLALTGEKESLKIVQTNHLGGKQKLVVIAWKDSQYLISLNPSGGFLLDKKPIKKEKQHNAEKNV